MTPEAETPPQAEPTMEEILASIRKIIASDKPEEAAPAASEEILELTEVVPEPAAAAPVLPPEPAPPPPPPPRVEEVFLSAPEPAAFAPAFPAATAPEDALLSATSAQASASVFAGLAQHLQSERQTLPVNIQLGDGQQTLEGLVTAIIRPMLKEWLDQNLPGTVERMVQREIERIARQHRD